MVNLHQSSYAAAAERLYAGSAYAAQTDHGHCALLQFTADFVSEQQALPHEPIFHFSSPFPLFNRTPYLAGKSLSEKNIPRL